MNDSICELKQYLKTVLKPVYTGKFSKWGQSFKISFAENELKERFIFVDGSGVFGKSIANLVGWILDVIQPETSWK